MKGKLWLEDDLINDNENLIFIILYST